MLTKKGRRSLKVWVDKKAVAEFKELPKGGFSLSYYRTARKEDAVSLALPVSDQSYFFRTMPASLGQNIPQGVVRHTLEEGMKKIRGFKGLDDMDLLGMVGRNQIGRVSFTETSVKSLSDPRPFEIDKGEVLSSRDSPRLFHQLASRPRDFGEMSGISGAVPKMLGDILVPDGPVQKSPSTLVYNSTIVKSASMLIPDQARNEYVCMDIAKYAGLSVADISISLDGGLLLIDRFDHVDGETLGFDDFSALASRRGSALADAQYGGTYRGVLRVAGSICKSMNMPESSARGVQKDLFERIVFSNFIRDNDLHLKNIGLLYDGKTAWVSPAYDVTCTDIVKISGMSMHSEMCCGWSSLKNDHGWKTGAELVQFGLESTGLSRACLEKSVSRIRTSMREWVLEKVGSVGNSMERDIGFAIAKGVGLSTEDVMRCISEGEQTVKDSELEPGFG